jgi:hypothetical protein
VWFILAIGCAAFFGWLGHRVFKGRKNAATVGAGLGFALVFYSPLNPAERERVPTPLVHIDVPADFKHDTVIFIHDPTAKAEIVWSKGNEGRIVSPKSGVIRVKSLGPLDSQESRALLSNGKQDWGLLNSNLDGDGARIVVYDFAQNGSSEGQMGTMSNADAARYVRHREAE